MGRACFFGFLWFVDTRMNPARWARHNSNGVFLDNANAVFLDLTFSKTFCINGAEHFHSRDLGVDPVSFFYSRVEGV